MTSPLGDSTRSVKAVSTPAIPGLPVAPPLVSASTYHLSTEDNGDLDTYGRSSNPTWRHLESALAQLEGANAALAFGSGMAAITAVLRVLVKPLGFPPKRGGFLLSRLRLDCSDFLVLDRRQQPGRAVSTLDVVEIVAPSGDDFTSLRFRGKVMPRQHLVFQGREERLASGVVEARPHTPHRLPHPELAA